MFNEDRIAERGESGELTVVVKRSRPLDSNKLDAWWRFEEAGHGRNNQLIAQAHRYLRPDGQLAASGLVDPKRVRRGDTIFILQVVGDETMQPGSDLEMRVRSMLDVRGSEADSKVSVGIT